MKKRRSTVLGVLNLKKDWLVKSGGGITDSGDKVGYSIKTGGGVVLDSNERTVLQTE